MTKNILCVPLDPVHDVGLKIIKNVLVKYNHNVELLMPDLSMEEIIKHTLQNKYDFILVSRTLGYGVYDIFSKFIDLCDAAGIRQRSKLVLGGKPVTPQLAAELGFDKGFSSSSTLEEIAAYINGDEIISDIQKYNKTKYNFVKEHTYEFFHKGIEKELNTIADKFLDWANDKTSDAIERAELMRLYIRSGKTDKTAFNNYLKLCSNEIKAGNSENKYIKGVRVIEQDELTRLNKFLENKNPYQPVKIQHDKKHPLIFKFLGSGCPIMDIVHGKICERWGTDGFLLINPSWEARYEGLFHDCLTHQNDGTITSLENISLIRKYLLDGTFLTVRAHRGLNTPETTMLAGEAGADMTKINLVYGSLGAGTDPERLGVDGLRAIKYAAEYNMPFDIPGNDELSGVPAYKTLAGLLINVMIGLKVGAKPIPKPLFCFGPHIMINGQMNKNFIDYNYAKIKTLRTIADMPIWPGEPIAFMTQSEERVQSANATSYHAALAAYLGVDAITIASTDEAYSRGPICIASRIDSLRAVQDAFKFIGNRSKSGLIPSLLNSGEVKNPNGEGIRSSKIISERSKSGLIPSLLNIDEVKNPNGECVRPSKIISERSKNGLIPSLSNSGEMKNPNEEGVENGNSSQHNKQFYIDSTTPDCEKYSSEMIEGIYKVLSEVAKKDNLPQAIYDGLLGNKEEDGAYPGTFGRGTIRCK